MNLEFTKSSWVWFEYLNMLPRCKVRLRQINTIKYDKKIFKRTLLKCSLYKVKMQKWFIVKLTRSLIVWHILVDILDKWHAFAKVNLPVVVHYGTIVKVYTCYIDFMKLWNMINEMLLICSIWLSQLRWIVFVKPELLNPCVCCRNRKNGNCLIVFQHLIESF